LFDRAFSRAIPILFIFFNGNLDLLTLSGSNKVSKNYTTISISELLESIKTIVEIQATIYTGSYRLYLAGVKRVIKLLKDQPDINVLLLQVCTDSTYCFACALGSHFSLDHF
jgi:hypothetical protein